VSVLDRALVNQPELAAAIQEILRNFEDEYASKVFTTDDRDRAMAWRERTYAARSILARIETLAAWREQLKSTLKLKEEESDDQGNF